MADPQLLQYIQRGMQYRVPPQQLRQQLIAAGWAEMDVYYAMKEAAQASTAQPVKKEKKSILVPLIILVVLLILGAFSFFYVY